MTASVTEMLQELNWATLELGKKRIRLTMLYKMHNGLALKLPPAAGRRSRHLHKSYVNKLPPIFLFPRDNKRMEQLVTGFS